jgi:hypothetical protein
VLFRSSRNGCSINFKGKNFSVTTAPYRYNLFPVGVKGTYWISEEAKQIKLEYSESHTSDVIKKQYYFSRNNGKITIGGETFTRKEDSNGKTTSSKKSSGSISAFPGRWSLVEGNGNAKNVEFFKDGTGIADGNGITWKIENGRFHILHPRYTFSAVYKVTGSTITFTQEDGKVVKYQKNKM